MAYFTAPLIIGLTIWLIVSLRRGEFNVYSRSGWSGWFGLFSDTDSGQFTRRNEPLHYWIAVGAIAGFDLFYVVITVIAIRMRLAW